MKGYRLIGDVLVSEKKLDDIDRRLSQLGEASLSKVTELMQDIGIEAPNQVLEALGYEVKWYGLDQDKAIISKSKTRIYRGGRRGHFDLAIIDPKYASESHWRMQVREPPYSRHRLKAAFEFGLNAIVTTRLDLIH